MFHSAPHYLFTKASSGDTKLTTTILLYQQQMYIKGDKNSNKNYFVVRT